MPRSASKRLEEFVFHPDPYHAEDVPGGIHRSEVVVFVESHINGMTGFRPLLQAEKLIDFYDLQEVCSHYKELLKNREPGSDDLLRLTVVARTMALVCPDDTTLVTEVSKYVAERAVTVQEFQELIWLDDSLDGRADTGRVEARINAQMQALAPKRERDYQAQLQYFKLEELRNLRLDRCSKAAVVKRRVLEIPDRAARIQEEIKMYLSLQYGYLEYLQPWAARRLRRETWAAQPDQQMTPVDKPALRAEVAEAFRQAMNGLDSTQHVPPENQASLRVTCLHAIKFFGGALSPQEVTFLQAKGGEQMDMLAN